MPSEKHTSAADEKLPAVLIDLGTAGPCAIDLNTVNVVYWSEWFIMPQVFSDIYNE